MLRIPGSSKSKIGYKVVWQAWTTEQMGYARVTPDEIDKSITNIFRKFDVASR